ncbi:hypothetical protein AMS68_004816 [Peltaster fructicola]|uniref:Uncharacterized protein n=1 Tax=Peltaster fructicola TaxID=286661 RepID=A0A6H0XXF3_9PEZI|nr:hypothetical protein AMS68_004816 [Peltaster fructicola]
MAPFRPAGRSNRSGRTQADNDVFEGLPVKQWTHAPTRVSLVPPASEVPGEQGHDRWAEPPMPRDYQLLNPWTQQLLRLARSGKLGQKRKPTRDADDADGEDYGAREDDGNAGDESNGLSKGNMLGEDRAFVAKKWRHVPEHALVPEHLHLEFLARSRKGLPSFYHNFNGDGFGAPVPMRKTKVSRVLDAATGETAVYEILVPEGQSLENEVLEESDLASKEVTALTVGTFIEGLGTANPDGVLVSEIRNAAGVAQRRNRPPPKKKGGPGRGKKRVTFTNPDGSTYTTIVPNATKIVPQPGQTVKHVAKGEEAARDITAEEAASMKAAEVDGDEEGDEDDDGDEGDEDGDDREEGELVEESAETDTKPGTPQTDANDTSRAESKVAEEEDSFKASEDVHDAVDEPTTASTGDALTALTQVNDEQPKVEPSNVDATTDIEMPDASVQAGPEEEPLAAESQAEPADETMAVAANDAKQSSAAAEEPLQDAVAADEHEVAGQNQEDDTVAEL